MTARRKLHIKTHGCQMNVYDSDRMTDVLAAEGFETTDRPEEADVIILNTCHIREKAAEKVYSELGRIRALKDAARAAGRQVSVGVAGCVAQAEGAEITRRARHVDFVLGPQSYHKLSEIVARAATGAQVVDTEFPVEDKFAYLPAPSPTRVLARGRAAFLAVQEGCDKFCTFCVVPYTRGAELSRSVAQVVEEARKLAASGVKELTLLGQNVNAYHGEGLDGRTWNLARLLHELAEIDGIERLRYTTSHPRDMDDDLIAAHGTLAALMPYLHLPVQSGSDRVLSAMNRRHGRAFYLDLIARIRDARPDIALSSDFIVGFPGETEAEFAETLSLAREVGYAQAFSFKYSPRPGTPAAEMDDQVPEAVKSERLARLHEVLAASQAAFNRSLIGRTMPVLFEREGRKPGQLVGRSPYLQPVQADAPAHLRGTTATVTITDVGTNSLFGTLTETSLADLLEDAAF